MNYVQPKTPPKRQVKSTSTKRSRHKLVFVFALAMLCSALIASICLLTMIVVRRRLQQQQQQPDVSDDEDYDAAPSHGHVPPRHNWTSSSSGSSTFANVNDSDQHRRATDVRAKDDSVSPTLSSRMAVFRALQTATWSTKQPTSTLSSRGDQRRHRQGSRRRRPSGRRHRGRQQHRNNGDKMHVARSAEFRRLARIALKRHLRTSNEKA